jgi:glucosamine--fructose-6-phosphate aminotransferase (isomerizing)
MFFGIIQSMCGIFAYSGERENAAAIVIGGLKNLEYRGYDSWGIAIKKDEGIVIHKEVGRIGDFDNTDSLPKSNIAFGHSRWATHGKVTVENAHPHSCEDNNVVIVHNGIFENYQEVKKRLVGSGHKFTSETDTEVIAHLIEEHMRSMDFVNSVREATKDISGRYAIVAASKDDNTLVAARRGSPIIIGVGESDKEYFIASDIPAFLEYTKRVIYLDDDQMVTIANNKIQFSEIQEDAPIEKRIIEIDWEADQAEKGDFPHFMIKEIMEQKETLIRAVNQDPGAIEDFAKTIKSSFGTYFVACGTAGKVCMAGEYLFSKIAKEHVNFSFGSEFSYHKHFLTDRTLIVAVSQSGETADTLEALEIGKAKGSKIASILNVESSTMARMSDIVLPIKAGPEKAVASTKATTSQLAILILLAYAADNRIDEGKQLLINTAGQINDMLNPRYEEHILELAKLIQDSESIYIIGRGINYPIALEAAIKLQEVSYIHAEGFAGGELKHGPIALISEGTPVIAIVPNDDTKNDILSNATEIKSRGGYIIGVAPENNEIFDYWIKVPAAGDASPIVNIIPIQILAYQLAVLRNYDPDKPRNLAKSVTVK